MGNERQIEEAWTEGGECRERGKRKGESKVKKKKKIPKGKKLKPNFSLPNHHTKYIFTSSFHYVTSLI